MPLRARKLATHASCGDCANCGEYEGRGGVKLKASLQQDQSAVGPKALHDVLCISSCSLQSDVKEESLYKNHNIISTQIQNESCLISTHALVDCGATGFAFIDEEFARGHNFPLFKLEKPRYLEVIDGRPIESSLIMHMTKLRMSIAGHKERIPLFVTKLGHYSIVLGLPWLRRHDVNIRFSKNTVTFDSDYCL